MSEPRPDLAGLERAEIASALDALGVPAFHGQQIFSWIHARGVTDFEAMTDLSRTLRTTLADAFIAMPGGFGTFEELCEAVTWTQLGLHRKRCGLLNVRGYYDPLLALFDRSVEEGFVRDETRDILVAREAPADLLDVLLAPPAPPEPRWLRSPQQT